jgi:hypothetical protein
MKDNIIKRNKYGDINDPNNKGPLLSGNAFTRFFFTFAIKVFRLGNQKHFTAKDSWGAPDEFCYGYNQNSYQRFSEKYPLKSNSLFSVLLKWLLSRWIWVIIAFSIGNFASIVFPYLLRATIDWLENSIKGTPLGKFKSPITQRNLENNSLYFHYFCVPNVQGSDPAKWNAKSRGSLSGCNVDNLLNNFRKNEHNRHEGNVQDQCGGSE